MKISKKILISQTIMLPRMNALIFSRESINMDVQESVQLCDFRKSIEFSRIGILIRMSLRVNFGHHLSAEKVTIRLKVLRNVRPLKKVWQMLRKRLCSLKQKTFHYGHPPTSFISFDIIPNKIFT